MNTSTKIGLGVGTAAVVSIAMYFMLRDKPAKAAETKPPTGGGTATPPPENTTSTVVLDDMGHFKLQPGNMGTLRVRHPAPVGIRSGGTITSFKSSDENVYELSGAVGASSISAWTRGAGATVLDVGWNRSATFGGGAQTSKITLVVE